jgi:hypothetical protein
MVILTHERTLIALRIVRTFSIGWFFRFQTSPRFQDRLILLDSGDLKRTKMKSVLLTVGFLLVATIDGNGLTAQQLEITAPAENKMLIDDTNEIGKTWRELFNGTDLNGWEQKNGTATFKVVDGTIKGTTDEGSPNSFLCTEQEFSNFELVFEVKVDVGLNSGVQIRSQSKPGFKKGRVHGPQVEIESDPGKAGYVYSEGTGRNWISPNRIQKNVFKNEDWNHYRVLAEGKRIQTWINGTAIADVETAADESQVGFIGLQVHRVEKGSGPYGVQWRNIKFREIPVISDDESEQLPDDDQS